MLISPTYCPKSCLFDVGQRSTEVGEMDHDPTFGLAPMEGVSELPFRLWISQTSAPAFACTPFLRATDSYPRLIPETFAPELDSYRELVSYRLVPQVMAARAEDFVRTARLLLDSAPFIDLNAGCPSPNPISGGAGSGLLRDPQHFAAFMSHVAEELPASRFSLKMRIGFDHTDYFHTYLDALKTIPLAQLTIHGRTRRDRYDGHSRWDLIAAASHLLSVPVVGSGDVVSIESWRACQRRVAATRIERVIIGRGALRNPWIFAELREGQRQNLSIEVLSLSMACLGLWFEAFHLCPDRLDVLVRSGCFRGVCGTDAASWREMYQRSVLTLRGQHLTLSELHFERPIMGRLKMVWNSFRSSLPPQFFSPQLLRTTAFAEWVKAWSEWIPAGQLFAVGHRDEWDWLYTSSRIKPEKVLSDATQETL